MSSQSRYVVAVSAGVLAILTQLPGHAQFNQWEHKNNVHSSLSFGSEGAAHADILASGTYYALLTEKAGKISLGATQVSQVWKAPIKDPAYTNEWVYKGYFTPYSWTSEAALLAAYQAAVLDSVAPCGLESWEVSSEWITTSSFLGLPQRQWKDIQYNAGVYGNLPEGGQGCIDGPGGSGSLSYYRDRNAACPQYYTADVALQKCTSSYQAYTYSAPITCPVIIGDPGNPRGNPCNVANGDKSLREVDYHGPGIEIAREFHSLSFSQNVGFGPHWLHNFSGYLLGTGDYYGASIPAAVVLHNGYQEPFRSYGSGVFVALSGVGLEARVVGSEIVLSFPSGAKEYYTTFPYGSNQRAFLKRKEDPSGRATTVTRDASNRIDYITGPFGHVVDFVYDGNGNLEKLVDPAGQEITYQYEAAATAGQWRLEGVTYQDGSSREYHYEDNDFPDYLTGVTDENDDRHTTYAYDDNGRVIESERTGGYGGVTLSYSANSTTVTDGNSNVTTYNFTTDSWLMRKFTSIAHGGTTRTLTNASYYSDYQRRPTSTTDNNGIVTTFSYDTHHKTSETEAYGTSKARTRNFYYLDNTTDRLTRVTSPSVYASQLREVETTYNSESLPETIETSGYKPNGTAVSRTVTLDYNAYGQVIEIDGPRTDVSDVTTLTYYECTTGDECGQLESVTNALGHETTFDLYDEHGRLLEMTDPNGVATEYTYDLRGQTTSMTETPPSGPVRVTTYTYDEAGQLETVEAPNGTILIYDYDAAHNLLSITDNAGNSIEYGYDLNGNRESEDIRDDSSTLRKTVDYTFDARNRVESINAAGSITDLVFDALGNLTDEEDPNSNDSAHDYDPLNRLISTLDALSGVTEYAYDKNDNLTSVEAPNGATTTYVFDDLGNLLSTTSPDTGTTTYTHDAAGNRVSQTDARSVTVNYVYDALNRLTSIDYPGSSLDVTFTYDQGTAQNGRLTTMADGSSTTTFEYDVFGNLVEESKSVGGNTHVTAYAYDEADLLTEITYPSGRTVDYTRNVLGQITTVASTYDSSSATVASSATYEPFGPLKGLTFGNSLVLARTFDQQYRLTDQTTGSVQDLGFTLDDAGNLDAITDGLNAGLSQGFAQDALHRLSTDAGSYGTKNFSFDSAGNRTQRTHGALTQTLTYTANSNRMATHDGQTISLDAAGNTLANPAESLSFTYGAQNRMVEAYAGAVLKASYVYDGRGQRITKIEATGAQRTIVYHYGLSGELLGETIYSSAGAKIGERDYLWLDSLPLAQSERTFLGGSVTGSNFVYLHADQLNTPRLATNSSGAVVWRWDSDAFGNGAANQDPDNDTNLVNIRLRFPGQYLDEETGLHYNYFRDYDAVTGRYIQSDPIGLAGGVNTYAYVAGNPLGVSDRHGLQAMCRLAVTTAGGVAGGAAGYACGCALGGVAGGAAGTLVIPGFGTVGGGVAGCGVVGSSVGAVGALYGAAAGSELADLICSDESDEKDCSKASPYQLAQAGIIDPHQFKREYGAVPNSLFDICACKDGSIVIKEVGGCGSPGPSIPTHTRWK